MERSIMVMPLLLVQVIVGSSPTVPANSKREDNMNQYFENCSTHKQSIIDNFSPATSYHNFFTSDEIDQLTLYQFKHSQRIKWTASSNNIQPVVDIDTMFDDLPWLDEKFNNILDPYYSKHTGNFYITTQLHDCHVDLLTDTETEDFDWTHNVIPYKSVVIPLMMSTGADAFTAFFDQRHIGHSITLDRNFNSHQGDSMYELARTYPTFYLKDGSESDPLITCDTGNCVFPQLDDNTLRGLSIENTLKFSIGDVMVFDACQLHASATTKARPNYKWLKSGINIQFYKEI